MTPVPQLTWPRDLYSKDNVHDQVASRHKARIFAGAIISLLLLATGFVM